jgi:putative membrane protein
MIEHYSDHAANERTFLAWVRTAIAIMAFGFLVQKFDLFLRIASQSLGLRPIAAGGQVLGTVAALLLIAMGGAIMVFAAIRFRRTAIAIESAELCAGPGARLDLTLVGLLTVIGMILVGYLIYTVVERF